MRSSTLIELREEFRLTSAPPFSISEWNRLAVLQRKGAVERISRCTLKFNHPRDRRACSARTIVAVSIDSVEPVLARPTVLPGSRALPGSTDGCRNEHVGRDRAALPASGRFARSE
jgi:hypothetical protein